MGRARVVNYYNDRYCGSMSEEQCDILEELIELNKVNGVLSDLKHIIYNLPDSDVITLIEECEEYGYPLTKIHKNYGTLRDDQTLAVGFMYSAKRCIIGDSVGMGKTVELAGTLNLLRNTKEERGEQLRYLVLTEKNLASQLRSELVKFTGEFV